MPPPPAADRALACAQDLVKQVLSALRAIAGNDDVKDAIVRAGGTDSIVAAMTRHLASPQVPALAGLGWMAHFPSVRPAVALGVPGMVPSGCSGV